MPISRRNFLGAGTLAALSFGVPLKAAAEALHRSGLSSSTIIPTPNSAKPSSLLSQQAFSNCLGSEFRIADQQGARIQAKLVEVYDWKSKMAKQSKASKSVVPKECFSAVFVAPSRTQLAQNTYVVEHSTLGSFSMFLVPAGKSARGSYYEAVFNNLH